MRRNGTTHIESSTRGRALLGALALLVALAAVASLRPALAKAKPYQPAFLLTEHVQEEVGASAFGLILGEARASLADVMWVKTERYLHRGIAMMPHLDANAMARTGEVTRQPAPTGGTANEAHKEHKHESEKTIVPEAAQDYRGYIGTIQRAIEPWQAPGAPDTHTNGNELIPWYRLLTYSNPHHWRGYLIGSWWLMDQRSKNPQALAEAAGFIDEAIRNNPEVFQLELMRGRIMIQQEAWTKAIAAFERAATLALKTRPAGGREQLPLWSESDEEDFAAAMRYIPVLQWHRLHDRAAAEASLHRARALLPRDRPLQELQTQLDRAAQSP